MCWNQEKTDLHEETAVDRCAVRRTARGTQNKKCTKCGLNKFFCATSIVKMTCLIWSPPDGANAWLQKSKMQVFLKTWPLFVALTNQQPYMCSPRHPLPSNWHGLVIKRTNNGTFTLIFITGETNQIEAEHRNHSAERTDNERELTTCILPTTWASNKLAMQP